MAYLTLNLIEFIFINMIRYLYSILIVAIVFVIPQSLFSQTPPYITSVLYDGCNVSPCSDEGTSEIAFAYSGNYSISVTSSNIDLTYPGSPAYDLLGTIVDVSSTTTAINTASGCPGTYLDGYNTTIPPNSYILFVPSNICTSTFSWDALCGTGPIYIVYGQNGTSGSTWHTSGNFGNSGGTKTFTLAVKATNGTTYTTTYSYTAPASSSATNGNYATYSYSGSNSFSAVTQGNFANCQITSTVLSTDLAYYTGYAHENSNYLNWETTSEARNNYFSISRSSDGINYNVIGKVYGAGTSDETNDYQFIDETPSSDITYYKLKSYDYDGTMYEKGIVAVKSNHISSFFNSVTSTIELPESGDIEIYNLEGKLILKSTDSKSIYFDRSGMFILRNLQNGETERILIAK